MGKRRKNIKRNEDNLRDLWDNDKHPNIQIIEVPEEEDKKKGHEKILEEIIVENLPKMGKEIATQAQETQRVPNRINPRQNTSRHILIKLMKILLLGRKLITNLDGILKSRHITLPTKVRLVKAMAFQ